MHIIQIQILVLLYSTFVRPLILDGNSCSAPSPCTCLNELVDCSSKQLSQVPTFNGNSHPGSQNHDLYILLQDNNLSVIPDNKFNALRLTGVSVITIFLYKNQIYSIRDNAFSGIENLVHEMDLEDNRLTALPAAIGKLKRLQVLYLQGNYLRTLDSSVLQNIGNSLTYLRFGAQYMSQWPSSLHLLHRLTELQVDKIPYRTLANDSFNGLGHSLNSLTILYSNLDSIPDAICSLQSLDKFVFDLNAHLKHVAPGTPSNLCAGPMTNISTIRFTNNNFTYFPDVFNAFPNAGSITVSGNADLYYIPTELANSTYNNLTNLNLDKNQFNSIPHAIGKLHKLISLSLKDNFIRVIDGDVFDALSQLDKLELNGNPVVYIENTAFDGLTSLTTLSLVSTKLVSIPDAVVTLPALSSLNLGNLGLSCTCGIANSAKWTQMKSLSITGQCSGGSLSVENYVRNYLTHC